MRRPITIIGAIFLSLILGACAAIGPTSTMESSIKAPLIQWPEIATQYDPDCYNLHTKYNRWGVFIGCQSIDIFDVRTPNVLALFEQNLTEQSCRIPLSLDGQRNYIRTGDHFLFIDKVSKNANAWYIPAGYYSDGVSTPDILREILPGAILDTESPRTLSAALFHDRYFCLFDYTTIAWNSERESYPSALKALREQPSSTSVPLAYRRRGCANVSFRNGLRTAGASSLVSTLFRRVVGLANPGGQGYCPQIIHAAALSQMEDLFERMLGVGPIGTVGRTQLPGCRAKEPLVLCLSNVEALWSLVTIRPDDYGVAVKARERPLFSDEWRQVLTRIMCYEIQALAVGDRWAELYSFDRHQAETVCGAIDFEELRVINNDIRDAMKAQHPFYSNPAHVITSPFRAGDFLIEAAVMLTQRSGPEVFLQTVSSARTIDYAMLSVVIWNENLPKTPEYKALAERMK